MEADTVARLVTRLREQGTDDGECEVKACAGGLGVSTWDSVSAFANTVGGWLVLGLRSPEFVPAEGFDLERVRDQLVEGMGDGGGPGRLEQSPAYTVERHLVDDAPVLAVRILENGLGRKPCFVRAKGVQGGSFKRVDDKDIKLSATEIFELQQALMPQQADRALVAESGISDLDSDLVDAVLERRRTSKALRGTTELQDRLARLSIATKGGQLRLAGLLVAGQYPQQFFPRLLIDVAVHPTNEKSSPGAATRFDDRVLCEGPLAEAVDEAVGVVARNLRTYAVVEGTTRRDELEIPREVLREAIANAVLHREYHDLFRGQPVSVDVYPDRVVVTNPGGLWGGKTVENLADGTSRCRNQTLVQLLQSTPLRRDGGVTVEGQGGGVQLMINEMQAHALDQPRFRITPDQVTLELRRHGAEVPRLREWLTSLSSQRRTPHQDAALLLARREGVVTVTRLREDLRIDSDEARALLAELSQDGLLLPVRSDEYVLWSDQAAPTRAEKEVAAALSADVPMDIHELAGAVQKSPNTLRPILRRMVAAGSALATAPPTSRYRKYLRSS